MSANQAARNFYRRHASAPRRGRVAFASLFAIATLSAPLAAQTPGASPTSSNVGGEDIGISTPEAWGENPDVAQNLLADFLETVGLSDLGGRGGTAAYIGNQEGAIYVAWVKAATSAEAPGTRARAVLDRLRAEPLSASLEPSSIEEVTYSEKKVGEAIEARFVWRHKPNETVTISRALVWLNPDKLIRVVRAECVFAEGDTEKVTPMCTGALGSMTADDLKKKTALALGDVGVTNAPVAGTPTTPLATPAESPPGPSMAPADPNILFKEEPKEGGGKKRWLFIFGALLVIFAAWSFLGRKSKESAPAGEEPAPNTSGDAPGGEEEE